jgi:hypothetical protein
VARGGNEKQRSLFDTLVHLALLVDQVLRLVANEQLVHDSGDDARRQRRHPEEPVVVPALRRVADDGDAERARRVDRRVGDGNADAVREKDGDADGERRYIIL